MSQLATGIATLLDVARRTDPATGSITTQIAELLTQQNEILYDLPWKEGNETTGHTYTVRTSLPTAYFRKLNSGTPNSKSTTAQVTESCAMIFTRSQIDKDVAMLNGGTAAWRLSENMPNMEAINQKLAQTLFYGDPSTSPEQFLGLAPRYAAISGATNTQNILSGGGSASVNTSIWLLGLGNNTIYGTYPKGSKAGLNHLEIKDGSSDGCVDALDASNNKFRAFVDEWQWKCGMAVEDWRYVVRIPNIDTSNLVAETSAADIIKLMSRSIDRIPNLGLCKPVFYMNRTVFSMLRIQAMNKTLPGGLTIEDALNQFGKSYKELTFQGIPVRKVDQLLSTEATIS